MRQAETPPANEQPDPANAPVRSPALIRAPRPAAYVATFLAALLLVTFLTPWKLADWVIFSQLPRGHLPSLEGVNLALVDVPYEAAVRSDPQARVAFRLQLAQVLRTLAAGTDGRPRAVVLDVHIGPEPEAQAELMAAVKALQAVQTKVFGALYLLKPGSSDEPNFDYMVDHARDFYRNLDGAGHTEIDARLFSAKYDPWRAMRDHEVPALPIAVAMGLGLTAAGDLRMPQMIDIGREEEVRVQKSWRLDGARFVPASAQGQAQAPRFEGAVIVLGSPASDRSQHAARSGPELMLWAIGARLRGVDDPRVALLLATPGLLVGMVVIGALLSTSVTLWAARRLSILQGGDSAWTLLAGPLAFGLLALAIGVVLLMTNRAYAQWMLPGLAAVLASIWVWRYLKAANIWRDLLLKAREQARDVDVFVSYSHQPAENINWVENQIVKPLREQARRPDGRRVEVFFDRPVREGANGLMARLALGETWYLSLKKDLNNSRVFVPIYSAGYFDRPWCRAELDPALKRHMAGGSSLPFIVPVALEPVAVPAECADIQYLRAWEDPAFVDQLILRVNELLALQHAHELGNAA